MKLHHKSRIKVRINETDLAGVVHYSNYFVYFSIAHWDLLESIGLSFNTFMNLTVRPTIIAAYCEYKSPAHYGDVLEVEVKVEEVKRKTVKYTYEIRREKDNVLIATGYSIHVFIDTTTGKSVEIPDWIREKLEVKHK